MSATVDTIIEELDLFAPAEVEAETQFRLYRLFDGFRSMPDRSRAIPAMFALLERYPEGELGSPGPLVHELEDIDGYETELRKSLGRQPTSTTVWMVNRILNTELTEEGRRDWLSALEAACTQLGAPFSVKEQARDFLEYQLGHPTGFPPEILELENRNVGPEGEPTLGQALKLAIAEWHSGNRNRELRLHLLFLAWYCNLEPPHLTGADESAFPSATLPELFREVFATFEDSIQDDPEGLYVVGLMASLTPYLLGESETVWEARSRSFRERYRELMPEGLPVNWFRGRGAFGDYFAGQMHAGGF